MATEIDIVKVEELAGQGLNMDQIALSLGIHRSTLFKRKGEESDLSDAIKRGQAAGLKIVTNALMESAKTGNVTAQIFYLKNRAPDEWKDRKDVQIDHEMRSTVINSQPDLTPTEWKDKHNPSSPTLN